MHDIDSVKKRIIKSMIAILLLIFALFGITYAYFTTKVKGNTNDKSVDVSAGKLELTYGDGNGFIKVDKIQPGEVIKSKTFTVKNTGDGDIDSYEVILENVVNELKYYNDLTYELECKSDIGTCGGSDDTFPIYDNSIITNSIKVGETHSYTLTLTYHETNLDQSDDMDKTIEAKVNIRDSEFNYTKLNIYGNTEGIGTLVNDDTNRFNGKFKIDFKSVGKNLFNISIDSSTPDKKLNTNITKPITISAINNNIAVTHSVWRLRATYKDGSLKYVGETGYAGGEFPRTFTATEDNPIVELTYRGTEITSGNYDIQVEYGSTATDYEPYEEKIYSIYVNEPLRCIDSTCDYVDLVNKKVIRKIKDDNGTLSILDTPIEEKIQSIDSDVLINRNIIVDGANVEQELDR